MSMQGKHVVITGPTAGIGTAAAHELARRGASLTLMCRNAEKAAALQDAIESDSGRRPGVILMDMADLSSVRQAGETLAAMDGPLDVLLHNAGVVNTTRRESADGFEETMAVNHFAPFLLTGLALPRVLATPGARIVVTSSGAHAFVRGMGFDDFHANSGYKTFREYGRSKLANLLFTLELANRLKGKDVTVNALHPGAVSTSLGTQNDGVIAKLLPTLLRPFFRTPEKGAETSVYLSASDEVADITGAYFYNCKAIKPKPWALDREAAGKLWRLSEQSVGMTYMF